MRVRSEFPHPVELIEQTFVELADGCRLSARLWLPAGASSEPVPAVFEFLPYRLNDGTAVRDSRHLPYLAGHGIACVRVDMRGSGESDGLLLDEYLPSELSDACEVIAWIAAQPWCTGQVGMMGISWSGFNALQVAALRPPALRAIATLCSTDDRYADDVHYDGGVVGSEMVQWAASMFMWNARPPDPAIVGERWREMWLDRMEGAPPMIEAWMRHQRRDEFWKHGSVCEDFGAIEAAVLAVGGWSDGYTNAVLRLLSGLSCPRRGLIGPWAHAWPQAGPPGPTIGFLQHLVRWWRHWLCGEQNGVMDGPMLTAYLQDPLPPAGCYTHVPGRWVTEPQWPSARIRPWTLRFGPDTLNDDAGAGAVAFSGVQSAGVDAGSWCPYGEVADWPGDQRAMDGMSACFTSAPLDSDVDVLGFPRLTLRIASDRPLALVSARLCELAPDGASTLVTRGQLNLAHCESHEHPSPLVPGEPVLVTFDLDACGHRFAAGNRIRIGLSPTYWPFAWPSPEPVTLTVECGESGLTLPVRPAQPQDADPPDLGEPEESRRLELEQLSVGGKGRSITRDLATGRTDLVYEWDVGGRYRLPSKGLEFEDRILTVFSIVDGDPLSASVRVEADGWFGRGEWQTRAETVTEMRADASEFAIDCSLRAFEGDQIACEREWTFRIPRDHG